ncbi:hypothetical protein SARC_04652 [Sphaeroforma arctica JP610]|uniref:Uncharacterized protein n=1 Tax=Sphaeroforma arctica JP610 TaxID=667725 RepID=A0A0L0G1Y4_9EUKA|nr:hypothetical protein SARC_04652 [Sphaeroforma arctica JP610]KNC83075.1 hypothetical protein SARC_04652 [Sphaeroforma arctica JP610]|eukprot:XP_014156977.1 hypothetical protein SARC_04652 [Sphaeroforma arctica JP610]
MNTSMASIPENTSAHTPNPRPKRPLNHGSGLSMSTSLGNRSSSDRLDSDIPSSRSVFSLFHPSSPTTARSLAPSMTSGPWQGVHRASVKAGHEIIQVVRVSILPLFFESETFTDFKHDLEAKNAEVRALSEAGLLGESMHTSRHASLSDSPIQL